MVLQITGNIAEFNQRVESFKSNSRIELEHKRKRSIITVCVLFGIMNVLFILLSFFAAIEYRIFFAAAFIITICLLIILIEPKTKAQIEQEVKFSVKNMLGDRQDILDKYYSGYILLAEIESKDQDNVQIRFDCKGRNDNVESYYLTSHYSRTTDKSCQGRLILDFQKMRCKYYYLDTLTIGDELTIENQFLPKG